MWIVIENTRTSVFVTAHAEPSPDLQALRSNHYDWTYQYIEDVSYDKIEPYPGASQDIFHTTTQ